MEEKPKRGESAYRRPCLICDGTAYEWGKYNQNGFVMWNFMGLMGGQRARRCLRCGNVQIFQKPPMDFPDVGSV